MKRHGCLLAELAEILDSEGMKIQIGNREVEPNPLNVLRKLWNETGTFLVKSFEVIIRNALPKLGLDVCTIYQPTTADISEALK